MEREMDDAYRARIDAAFEGNPGKTGESRKSWLKSIEKQSKEVQCDIPEARKADAGENGPLEMAERRLEAEQRRREDEKNLASFGELAVAECDRLQERVDACTKKLDERDNQRAIQQQMIDAALRGGAGGNVVAR
jgi:hypothetical protein